MRVLRVSHSAVVSAWRERERELRRAGADVRLITARRWNEGGSDVPFMPDGDDFAEGARTIGRHPNLFAYNPLPIWHALRSGRWDVVDIHEEPCSVATFEVLLLRRLAGVRAPVVLYSAQNIDKRYPVPFRWMERWALRTARGVSVCNAEAGRILRRKGLRGVTAEIPLGVDIAAFAGRDRSATASPLHVGYVGRLEAYKGVVVVMDAVAQLADVRLTIVGSGPQEQQLRARVAEAGVGDRVRFRGGLSGAELAEAYREFDVLVVPSLPTPGWLEQFGRVAAEAMAAGVPVIASDSGALPDVLAGAGLLVAPGDAAELAAVLERLSDEPVLWSRLREAGLRRAEDFTWPAVARAMTRLYGQVTGGEVEAGRELVVVVVAYGSPAKLDAALAPLAGRFPITVVDNAADPATRAVAERHRAEYLGPGANLGFAGGVNHALRRRRGRGDVLLLNPDAIIDAAGVEALQHALAADPGLACVGPAQTDPDGNPTRVLWPFPTPAWGVREAAGLGRLGSSRSFVIGSVLLLRDEAISDVGEFDERFFLYAEETDWQWRAHRKGWRTALVPGVRAVHEGAGTGGDPAWREGQFIASHELYLRKNHGSFGWAVYRWSQFAGAVLRGLVFTGARRDTYRRRARLLLHGPVAAHAGAARPGSGT